MKLTLMPEAQKGLRRQCDFRWLKETPDDDVLDGTSRSGTGKSRESVRETKCWDLPILV